MKITKNKKTIEKNASWFCGCDRKSTSTEGYYEFGEKYDNFYHKKYFVKKLLANVYVCHKNKKVAIQKYKVID